MKNQKKEDKKEIKIIREIKEKKKEIDIETLVKLMSDTSKTIKKEKVILKAEEQELTQKVEENFKKEIEEEIKDPKRKEAVEGIDYLKSKGSSGLYKASPSGYESIAKMKKEFNPINKAEEQLYEQLGQYKEKS